MARRPAIHGYFVCIGAQKAGTTWLAKMLARHPDVFFTPVKEIHYFDYLAGLSDHLNARRRRSRYRKYFQRLATQWHRFGELAGQWGWYRRYMSAPLDDGWYAGLFETRRDGQIAGEATPEYAIIGAEGFRHIKRLAPGARVIYLMRNPVTRAWSQILHHCRANRLDAARMTPDELIAIAADRRFEDLADYPRTLDALAGVFPGDRVWLGFYEEIHADRRAALEQVCGFLGLPFSPDHFPALEKRVNPSQPAAMPGDVHDHLRTRYAPLVRAVEQRVGRLPQAWRDEFADAAKGKRKVSA